MSKETPTAEEVFEALYEFRSELRFCGGGSYLIPVNYFETIKKQCKQAVFNTSKSAYIFYDNKHDVEYIFVPTRYVKKIRKYVTARMPVHYVCVFLSTKHPLYRKMKGMINE